MRYLRQPGRAQRPCEPIDDGRLSGARQRHGAARLAGIVIAGDRCNTFQDGRLADAILADEDREDAIKFEVEALLEDRQAERKRGTVLDPRSIEHDAPEIGR